MFTVSAACTTDDGPFGTFFLSRVNKTLTVTVNNPWLGIIALIWRGTSNAVFFCLSRWDFSLLAATLLRLNLISHLGHVKTQTVFLTWRWRWKPRWELPSTLFPWNDGESASYLCHPDQRPLRTDEDFNYVFIIKDAHGGGRRPAAKARDGAEEMVGNKSERRRSARPWNSGRFVMDAPC